MAVKPIPEGFHSITPHLVVEDAARAIDWYIRVFGAEELPGRMTVPGGKVAHAEIRIGDSIVMISDEFPDWSNHSPRSLGGTPLALHLYVEDVDAVGERAIAEGAKVVFPIQDQFYGDRAGRLEDPFGHYWIVATHLEDLGPDEMAQRFEDFMSRMQE